MTLKLSKVERVEVVRGTRSHWVEGAAIGFVPGAVFLGAVVYVMGCDDYNASCNTGEAVLAGLVGGVATAGVGALIGLAVKSDRWVKVPLPKPKVALSLAPMRGGLRAAVTVRFLTGSEPARPAQPAPTGSNPRSRPANANLAARPALANRRRGSGGPSRPRCDPIFERESSIQRESSIRSPAGP